MCQPSPFRNCVIKKKKSIWLSERNFQDQVEVILKEPLKGDILPYLQDILSSFLICILR